MEENKVYNYYVNMVRFIRKEDEPPESGDPILSRNVEMIVVLIHAVRKDVNIYRSGVYK